MNISELLKHSPIPWPLALSVTALVLWLFWLFVLRPPHDPVTRPDTALPLTPETVKVSSAAPLPQGPPWIYGRPDARFTLIEYADLECPYCQAYFPILRQWIDINPEINWQWHHLPLPEHEPAATYEARIAECAGELGGQAAFWETLSWIYTLTAGNGEGIPDNMRDSDVVAPLQPCLDSPRPDAVIQAQVQEAAQAKITATPTLRLRDHQSGKTLLLHGPMDGDALLSAIDLLTTPEKEGAEPDPSPVLPSLTPAE